MVVLLDFVSLLVLLNSACSTVLAGDSESPIVNVRLDSRKKILSWNTRGIVTRQTCAIVTPLDPDDISPNLQVRNNDSYFCTFPNAVLHQGATLTVNATSEGREFSHQLTFTNPGKGKPMHSWGLVVRSKKLHREGDERSTVLCLDSVSEASTGYPSRETWPCPKYMQNQQGVNVQCHFDSISLKPQLQSHTLFRFLVNGTSGGSKIPCRETLHRLQEIEILAAPNITKTWCNKNYSFMEWEVKSLFTEDLKYELEIQKALSVSHRSAGVSPCCLLAFQLQTELKTFMLRNPGSYTVKVKAMDSMFFRRRPQGQWSAPQHLDCDRKDASFPLWLVYLLAPLGALLLVGLLFLCRRFSRKCRTEKHSREYPAVQREDSA
ncbi:hypothetical protein G4228_019594 [Cervus hanglu yarkandensis]|uniref:IL-3 receptor alpha chain N-terminal domain-containing protein n=1 Tax=Cervus hanglu yarkandensis TaxID=84702 RepID=A0A833WB40_9CERV|nr:hypothetical protein G4228_019594 [Cervus hanglu yarkandensis]